MVSVVVRVPGPALVSEYARSVQRHMTFGLCRLACAA